MRWFWVDRFTEFVSGERATAIKAVSLSEEVVDEYAPGRTCLPASLIVEGMAQAGGLLVGQLSGFTDRIVLAKIMSASFEMDAYPGDTLTFHVELQSQEGIGAVVNGTTTIDGKPHGKINLMFAKLEDERFTNVELFEPAEFCRMIRLMRLFEVGVNPDGSPIEVPSHMVEAEKRWFIKH
jgi:3-hydroxyacyl-[acyl-carrier-protein] dehydratase